MSIFNGEKSLDSAIESILKQSFKDFEFILIDDASTDNSYNIIKKYSESDARIKIIRNTTNIGLTKSLNKALLYCQGEFIARQDVDDLSFQDRFKEQIDFLTKNPDYAFCGTNGFRKKSNQNLIKFFEIEEIRKNLVVENCFSHPSVVLRKSILDKYGYYNESFLHSQDFELWCRLIYKYRLKAINLKNPLIVKDYYSKKSFKKELKKFIIQRFNTVRTLFMYQKYIKYKVKFLISIIIYLIEMFTFFSLIEKVNRILTKINFINRDDSI